LERVLVVLGEDHQRVERILLVVEPGMQLLPSEVMT
jgi:hypothetical protein